MAGPVRQPIDLEKLTSYLESQTDLRGPFELKQFGYGQSNPTYLLTSFSSSSPTTSVRHVLRKKPPGALLNPTAHAVEREHRVLSALVSTSVPVPTPIHLCTDSDTIGSPFYIMSFLPGRIFVDPSIPDITPAERTALWTAALRTLGALHTLIPADVGLAKYGRHGGFYSRQLKTLAKVSAAQSEAAPAIPGFDKLCAHFARTQPADTTTIVHGDYKIDNLVFHPTESRVIGILDWELSTLGHPLSDLSNLLTPYFAAHTPEASVTPNSEKFMPGATEGLLSIQDAVKVYQQARGGGYVVEAVKWGMAFGFLRNAVIAQGVTARHARGQASSARAGEYKTLTPKLAAHAWTLCREDAEERGIRMEKEKL